MLTVARSGGILSGIKNNNLEVLFSRLNVSGMWDSKWKQNLEMMLIFYFYKLIMLGKSEKF